MLSSSFRPFSLRVFGRDVRPIAAMTLLCMIPQPMRAPPTTSVVLTNLAGGEPASAAALVDADGTTRLTAGTTADGDGAVVALGYFTGPVASSAFSGTWVPLTGPASANVPLRTTSVGDGSSGGVGAYGFIETTVYFDQANPATFHNTPPAGTPLAVAVYNNTTLAASTRFNIATNATWKWIAPSLSPDFVFINLNDPGTAWFGGAVTARRTDVALGDFPAGGPAARLINISTRGYVGTGASLMIPGFYIGGTGTKRVLVRAASSFLAQDFGMSGTLDDPVLQLVRQDNDSPIASNDNWSDQPNAADVAAAMIATYAYPMATGSRDAAVLVDLPAGAGYTAKITGAGETTGLVLAEVYVVSDEASPSARAVNISTRGVAGTGNSVMIPGFYLGSGSSRRLLIRAASSFLAEDFGMSGTLADPVLRVYRQGENVPTAENNDWESDGQAGAIAAAAAQVYAYPLRAGTKDAALILDSPGNRSYTVHVSGADGGTGLVLTEVYELP